MDKEHLDEIKRTIAANSDYKDHYHLQDYFEVAYIDELVNAYDMALDLLSNFEFEIPCENDKFFDEHCEWCDENCSVDEEQYKKCWNKFIEWKLSDKNG